MNSWPVPTMTMSTTTVSSDAPRVTQFCVLKPLRRVWFGRRSSTPDLSEASDAKPGADIEKPVESLQARADAAVEASGPAAA